MLVLAAVLALAAAGLHVVIFRLESLVWDGPAAEAVFGPRSAAEIAATRALAFNQGFYNLFLAVLAAIGAVLALAGSPVVGITLMVAGTGCMLAAALVLLLSSADHRSAAVKQGALPLLTLLALGGHALA